MSNASKEKNMSPPKKTEKLDNVIRNLRSHFRVVEYSDSSDEDMNEITILETTENGSSSATTKTSNNVPSGDTRLPKSYLMWQNSANVCWLDASMVLLVHNRTLIECIDESHQPTQIASIIQHYYEANSILNDISDSRDIEERVKAARELLKAVQESVLKYLRPIVKYTEGEPDSAFCSLFNLICENKSIKDFFDLEYTWVQVCQKCKTHRAKKHKKPIITLPRVKGSFQPGSPQSLYQCPVCKAPDQIMTLNFRTLPRCLLFHFESGAGKEEMQCSSFEVDGRTYQMTGVMILEKGKDFDLNHFLTHIRDPSSDSWLECNDLVDDIKSFTVVPPFIELNDVYIMMFEALDENGTVSNRSLASDKCGLGEEAVGGSADIPLIDLADDADKDGSILTERRCRGSGDKTSVNKYSLNMNSKEIDVLSSNWKRERRYVAETESKEHCEMISSSKYNNISKFRLNKEMHSFLNQTMEVA